MKTGTLPSSKEVEQRRASKPAAPGHKQRRYMSDGKCCFVEPLIVFAIEQSPQLFVRALVSDHRCWQLICQHQVA